MRIAAGQFSAGKDPQANLVLIEQLMDTAAQGGAELLVLPESSHYAGTGAASELAEVAEPLDGPFVSTVAALASRLGLPVVVGITEANPEGLPYNTLVALSVEGTVQGIYRKIHLYDAFSHVESEGTGPGPISQPYLLSSDELQLGMMTCYDLRFPESARYLVDAGANVLLVPAMWIAGPGKEDHWNTLVRARAIENTSYVVTANQCGPLATGYSIIVDPFGVVVANAGEAPGVIFADLVPERIDTVRTRVPSLLHRRFKVIPAVL